VVSDDTERTSAQWSTSPSAKARTAVMRSVTALLDELAPERVLTRVEQLKGPVEQYRSPSGCVLQAATAAVSVTWFPEAAKEGILGELHVVVWHGRVTRRGVPKPPKAATVAGELVLHPTERPADEPVWETKEGEQFTTASLSARILELLEKQVNTG
jgi:hypothetical protein